MKVSNIINWFETYSEAFVVFQAFDILDAIVVQEEVLQVDIAIYILDLIDRIWRIIDPF